MRRFGIVLSLLIGVAACAQAESLQPADVAVQRLADRHAVRFTLITPQGYVGFEAGEAWTVLDMQSHAPITVTAFQIHDPADIGTTDSTNIVVSLFQSDSPQAQQAMAMIGKTFGAGPVVTEQYRQWTVYRRQAMQQATPYTILDAKAPVADMICGVRMAWPHLKGHDGGYDAGMEALFRAMLDSVSGGMGAYSLHEKEIVRRPDK